MTKISSWAFIIIGAFVAAFSYFSKNTQLKMFIYIGIAMVAFGIVKHLIMRFTGLDERIKKKKQKIKTETPGSCPKCHFPTKKFFNYCPNCALRLR